MLNKFVSKTLKKKDDLKSDYRTWGSQSKPALCISMSFIANILRQVMLSRELAECHAT